MKAMAGLLKFILIVTVFLVTVYGKDLEKCPEDTKGNCLHFPKDCDKTCKAKALVGKKNGTDNVYIVTYERADITTNGFLAVGMSRDTSMGEDLAVGCIKSGTTIRFHTVRTVPGNVNLIAPTTPPLLMNEKGVVQEGNLNCTFEIKFPIKFADLDEFTDETPIYLLMSFGQPKFESPYLQDHRGNRVAAVNPFTAKGLPVIVAGTGSGGGGGGGPTTLAPGAGDKGTASTQRVSFQQIWTSGAFMWIGIGIFVIPFIFV